MLTISEFAKKIGKSRQWVHKLMEEGRICPAPKLLGSYYVLQNHARVTKGVDKRKVGA